MANHYSQHYPAKDAQGCDLAPIFGYLSESENHSEIKPPLESKTI